ncbi:MAG: GTPase [Pseudohongiella sp.]|nr:GTPase [Pseudohongiella sp.]
MNRYFESLWHILANTGKDGETADLAESVPDAGRPLPVIWLLGKTGAGKSSLIRALTGLSAAEVGNGFEPCTRTADMLDFPEDLPVMRFLDTRGLGEAGYDPTEDLSACEERSHVLLVVARLDDPVQREVAAAIASVRKRRPDTPIIVVHTGADLLPEEQTRFRARQQIQQVFEQAARKTLPAIETSLLPGATFDLEKGIDSLVTELDNIIPDIALVLVQEERRGVERGAFSEVRARVLWYASAAAASDVPPIVGAVTVPAIQAQMLRRLGQHYGVEWSRFRMVEFTLALGTGAAARFGASYAVRQLVKLIPAYGQTVGAAAAGTISFAATYALGRAAAFYLHRTQQALAIDTTELRALYADSLKKARHERR